MKRRVVFAVLEVALIDNIVNFGGASEFEWELRAVTSLNTVNRPKSLFPNSASSLWVAKRGLLKRVFSRVVYSKRTVVGWVPVLRGNDGGPWEFC